MIELPLILLLEFLALSDLISFFVFYVGILSVSMGGMCIALAIVEVYVRKKHLI